MRRRGGTGRQLASCADSAASTVSLMTPSLGEDGSRAQHSIVPSAFAAPVDLKVKQT
jgi:hypothetical protein